MRTVERSAKRPTLRAVGLVALFSLLMGVNVTTATLPAQADPIQDDECFPAVLMLRGSGEPQLDVEDRSYFGHDSVDVAIVETNGHEGPTLQRVLEAAVLDATPAKTISKLRFIGVEYPAAAVGEFEPAPYPTFPGVNPMQPPGIRGALDLIEAEKAASYYVGEYSDSISLGAINAVEFILDDIRRGCDTQYILMGYSQGALAARTVMNIMGNNTDKIISSYLIGDPFQRSSLNWNERQISSASTGSHKEGLLRGGLSLLADLSPQVDLMNTNLTASDQVAYFDDADRGITSRFICHDLDLVCAFWGYLREEEQHTNYFLDKGLDSPGYLDLSLEIPAFDNQLEQLATSQTANPRERMLTKGISITDKPTSYNVANMRPDDICSWDVGSDGIYETNGIPCGLYQDTYTDKTAKMTVKIFDSFGITHTYSSEEPVIDPEEIANLTSVPYDRWIRYESFVAPTECITMPHDITRRFYGTSSWGTTAYDLRSAPCLESPDLNYGYHPTQVFKRTKALAGDGTPTNNYLWGYDDEFRVTSWYTRTGDGGVRAYPARGLSNGVEGPEVELAQIRNGTHYYQFKVIVEGAEWCTSHNATVGDTHLQPCDVTKDEQLFKAVIASAGEEYYGALSLERDVTPPTKVTGFELVEVRSSGYAAFRWNLSTDERFSGVIYYRIEIYDPTYSSWRSPSYIYDPQNTGSKYLTASNQKVRISACDHSYNCSEPTELTVPWTKP